MVRTVRFVVALALLGILLMTWVGSTAAESRKTFESSLVGIPTGGLVLDGVTGGGVPWSINAGRAILTEDGGLHVVVNGLVVTATGANPSATGRAAVICDGAVVAMTDPVDFSPTGDAVVNASVSIPSPCLDVAVMFLNGAGTRWFAVTGF
jgi:hypothetical protein